MGGSKMDLWQLNIFCKVVEMEGFSKAGSVVHLSQPTISSHIKDLENHFECQLIDRLGKKVTPTKAGELLYNYARRILALRDETETAMTEFLGKIKGRLVIGGSTIPGEYILPQLIGAFTKDHPGVTVSLIIGDTDQIILDTLSGALELGIVGAKTLDKNIVQTKLLDDEMRLIVPSEHKLAQKTQISLKQALQEPFIIRERGSGTLKSIQASLVNTDISTEDFNIVSEMGSTTAVIQGIKSNVGISILSTIAVTEELQEGSLSAVAINGLNLKRSFYLTRHKYRSTSPLCNAFIAFLNKALTAQ